MKHWLYKAMTGGVGVLSLLWVVALLSACGKTDVPKPVFFSTDVTGADIGGNFTLTDHAGNLRTLEDFKGKVVALFFGYTHCPDVCPATMGKLATAMGELGAEASHVQVLFVTVDPERDTAAALKEYLSAFNPDFLGLYGDERATRKITREYRIHSQMQPGEAAGHHTVDHSTGTYILDTKGKVRLYVSSDKGVDVIVHDISELLRAS